MYVLVGEQIFRIVPGIRRKRQVEKGFSQNFAKVADSSVRKNLAKNEEKSGSKPICPWYYGYPKPVFQVLYPVRH